MDYATKLSANVKLCANGCHEWQAYRMPSGYGRTRYLGANMLAHRLAWIVANGPIPDGQLVCHSCDNPPCCNPAHLFLGAHRDNSQDALRKGRLPLASLAEATRFRRHRKLTDAQVHRIQQAGADISTRTLAVECGCTWHNVHFIRNGTRKVAPARPQFSTDAGEG